MKNGDIRDFLWSAVVIDFGDELCSLSGIVDITERKQAEEALVRSEKRFRDLAELLPETIFEIDMDGKLTFANRRAFDQFLYTQQDFERGINGFRSAGAGGSPKGGRGHRQNTEAVNILDY